MQVLGSLTHKGVSGIHSYIFIQVEVGGGAISPYFLLYFPMCNDEKLLPSRKYVNVEVEKIFTVVRPLGAAWQRRFIKDGNQWLPEGR